jgi:hypothetical protein
MNGAPESGSVLAGNRWTSLGRTAVFFLAASSIACLLFDFYRVCPMRIFTIFVFVPALVVLFLLAFFDALHGNGRLWRAVHIGLTAGILAALAYDVFRLPFVFSKEWGIDSFVPQMKLFNVFPGFGAMILGQPVEQANYSTAAHVVGWIYHFSNGATFGVMYIALIGNPAKRHWAWAVLMALALEIGMLLTPYPHVFGIAVTPRFVVVTVAAHAIFGVGLGLAARRLATFMKFSTASLPLIR